MVSEWDYEDMVMGEPGSQPTEAQQIERLLAKHSPETGRREPYCSCGAPLGDWGADTFLHWGEVIVAAGFHREKG